MHIISQSMVVIYDCGPDNPKIVSRSGTAERNVLCQGGHILFYFLSYPISICKRSENLSRPIPAI